MSKKPIQKKKVVVTTKMKQQITAQNKSRSSAQKEQKLELVYGKSNFVLMGIGVLLILLGLILMTGGAMPSPDIWDESIIYSFRRTVIAPILILAGLILEIVAIFKKSPK